MTKTFRYEQLHGTGGNFAKGEKKYSHPGGLGPVQALLRRLNFPALFTLLGKRAITDIRYR